MGIKIFVGDDSISIKKVIEMASEGKDWNLRFFNEGDSLFSMLESEGADILIVSQNLPGKSIPFILNWIEENRKETKVIIMKGAFDEDLSAEVKNYETIDKPFSSDQFVEIINKLTKSGEDKTSISLPEEDEDSMSVPSFPEEVEDGVGEAEKKENNELRVEDEPTYEALGDTFKEGVGVYPVGDVENVEPSEEKTRESSTLKTSHEEKFEKEKEEFDNPFLEDSFSDDNAEMEEDTESQSDVLKESTEMDDNADFSSLNEEIEEEDEDEKVEFNENEIEKIEKENSEAKIKEGKKEVFDERITSAPTLKLDEEKREKEKEEEDLDKTVSFTSEEFAKMEKEESAKKEEITGNVEATSKEEKTDETTEEEEEIKESLFEEEKSSEPEFKREKNIEKEDTKESEESFKEEIFSENTQEKEVNIDEELIKNITSQKIEEILWEILPPIAEKIIREELEKLKKELTELEEN